MKRRRRFLLIALGAVVAAVLVAALWPGEKEPEYEGKKLTDWLVAYVRKAGTDPAGQEQAANAVRHIGTNALPVLVKWMRYNPPQWRRTLDEPAVRLGRRNILNFVMGYGAVRAQLAPIGFEILGPEAAPAIPALTNLLANLNPKSRQNFENAVFALSRMGNAGLAPLVSVVTNQSTPWDYRVEAAGRIRNPVMHLDTNANWAVPVLIECLGAKLMAPHIATILGNLKLEPGLAIPALTLRLRGHSSFISTAAAKSLGNFGTNASAAVPDLLKALDSNDRYLRREATNALLKIAPEVLKNDKH